MRAYFYGRFRDQLAGLETYRQGEGIYHSHDDPTALQIGVDEWKHVKSDLATVPEEDRPRFILSLFMIILTDQALHARFRRSYEAWRIRTRFPKFGSRGMTHCGNPFEILWAPERDAVIDPHLVMDLIPGFARFYLQETTNYFHENLPTVGVQEFLAKVRADRDYAASVNLGTIAPRMKAALDALTFE